MKKRIINKLNLTRLFSKSQTPNFPIDIIVPVYNGYEYLSPLFESIYNNTDLDYNLIVVNDASPDKKVLPLLNKYQKKFGNKMTLINNETNRGFIFSVNTALKTIKNHCVLVNTDVVLPKNWASKLFTPIYLDKKVASVTPFSNNATIFSLPKMNENELLGDLEEINQTLSIINTPFKKIKLPTGVGFCMAMNKNAIQKVGLIDEIFGRGYCEENDWCMRAIKHGFYNTIAANLLVWHKHGASFGDEKQELIKQNEIILKQRHPDYFDAVNDTVHNKTFLSLRFFAELLYIKSVSTNNTWLSIKQKSRNRYILSYTYTDISKKIVISKQDLNVLKQYIPLLKSMYIKKQENIFSKIYRYLFQLKQHDIIYSIGRDCACSFYLQTNKLRTTSGPMDWITTADFKQRFDMLLNDFEDFMNPEYFEFLPKNPNVFNDEKCDYYRNRKTGFDFYHDFPINIDFKESFPSVAEKYNRRIKRFYKNIKENNKVLLVWFSHYTNTNNDVIIDLCKKFCKKMKKNIDFLIIEHTENLHTPQKTLLAKNIIKWNLHTRDIDGTDVVNGNKELVNTIFQNYQIKITNKTISYWIKIHILCSLIPIKKWRHNARKHINRKYYK